MLNAVSLRLEKSWLLSEGSVIPGESVLLAFQFIFMAVARLVQTSLLELRYGLFYDINGIGAQNGASDLLQCQGRQTNFRSFNIITVLA